MSVVSPINRDLLRYLKAKRNKIINDYSDKTFSSDKLFPLSLDLAVPKKIDHLSVENESKRILQLSLEVEDKKNTLNSLKKRRASLDRKIQDVINYKNLEYVNFC